MVEFKVVISDGPKSWQIVVDGHHANSLVGKKIGDEVDGIFVSLPGYKLQITGGVDRDGFVMRKDVPGISRKRILTSKSIGFKPKDKGVRKRITVAGNTISLNISQINMKVIKKGAKPVEELLAAAGKIEAKEKEAKEEK
ncbi:MAG: 30S ribosomal protein S6e [Thermoplasmata archaeon]|nr:MAG: 30S ribosomal protein S6e [Thermoplasmata archaeon]MCD6223276.1 30S ribosomal protein S6e [Thermoplasmata archaeon]